MFFFRSQLSKLGKILAVAIHLVEAKVEDKTQYCEFVPLHHHHHHHHYIFDQIQLKDIQFQQINGAHSGYHVCVTVCAIGLVDVVSVAHGV